MKKFLPAAMAAILLLLLAAGCGPKENNSATTSTVDNGQEETQGEQVSPAEESPPPELASPARDVGFDFSGLESYVMYHCCWFDNTHVLLVFTKPAEMPETKMFIYDLAVKTTQLLYNGPVSVNYGDNILLNSECIGYQNSLEALVFSRAEGKLTDYVSIPEDNQFYYSPDMKYLAEVVGDDLFVTNTATGMREQVDTSDSFIGLTWNEDSSKLMYISNYGSAVRVVNMNTNEVKVLQGGSDFKEPEGIVQLMYCYFLPGDRGIVLSALCEDSDAFTIVDGSGTSRVIYDSGSSTVMDISERYILYASDQRDSDVNELVCYDYVDDTRNVVFSSTDFVVAGGFSPSGTEVIFGTFWEQEQRLHTCELP